jgi:crotonobetainyl-CoA:carnitine CoA-transferase CaiB-like acyl-CoA transferase
VFKIADGWMSLLAFTDRDWRILCTAMQMPTLADDPRFATRAQRLANDVAPLRHRTARHRRRAMGRMDQRLTEAGLMHERLNSYAEFLDQPHVPRDRADPVADPGRPQPGGAIPALPGMLPQAEGTPRGSAPRHGQHTGEVLAAHGFAAAEIDALLARGTVAGAT